jgi:hypothetical protein
MRRRDSRFDSGDRQVRQDSSFGQALRAGHGRRRILTDAAISTFLKHPTILVCDDYQEGNWVNRVRGNW